MKKKTSNNIPIIYYHSIANHNENRYWSFLSVRINIFKKQINYLKKNGYKSCDWKELEDHIKGVKELPNKTIMFHFDDGFLDNWSVVFPIMKEAGFKYSIVITPDFVQKKGDLRPFVKETSNFNLKNWWGYLNETEIKYMANTGLVDFQAHGNSHTWYEASDEIIDIYDGVNFYPHLLWNLNVEKKPYWLTDEIKLEKGYPIFKYKKSLELEKRFFPNSDMIQELIKAFDENLSKEENLKNYKDIIEYYKIQGLSGSYETEEQKKCRLETELLAAKNVLSEIIGKPVEYLVFPGGGNSFEVIDLCKKYGYRLISKGDKSNSYNSNIYQVHRLSGAYNFPLGNILLNQFFLRFQLLREKGNNTALKLAKLLRR